MKKSQIQYFYNFNESGNPDYVEVFIKTMIFFSYLILFYL